MVERWEEDPMTFHIPQGSYGNYSLIRIKHLVYLLQLYDDQLRLEDEKNSERCFFRSQSEHVKSTFMHSIVKEAQDRNKESDRPLVGSLFIAASGPTVTATGENPS